jgi:hypothetical protein
MQKARRTWQKRTTSASTALRTCPRSRAARMSGKPLRHSHVHMTYVSHVSYIWHTSVMSAIYDIYESCLLYNFDDSYITYMSRVSYIILTTHVSYISHIWVVSPVYFWRLMSPIYHIYESCLLYIFDDSCLLYMTYMSRVFYIFLTTHVSYISHIWVVSPVYFWRLMSPTIDIYESCLLYIFDVYNRNVSCRNKACKASAKSNLCWYWNIKSIFICDMSRVKKCDMWCVICDMWCEMCDKKCGCNTQYEMLQRRDNSELIYVCQVW